MNGQEKVKLPTVEEVSVVIDSGLVSAPVNIGGNALSDSTKNWANNVHKNRLVKITKGPGVGQLAVIAGNSSTTLLIRGAWPQSIAAGASYEILGVDIIQVLRDVFGGGLDISPANPLETHDPKVEDVEDKLDHPSYGLAALKALIDSLAGGAFYGSYGPKNVEVDNEVDFGTILYDPAGNIITVGEVTPGTYTIHRVRVAADTEIVPIAPAPAPASSEAAGRVYLTYAFPNADWNVGDIFYITFSGIIVTANGITTEYPNLFIWGRVVREADVSAKVDAVEAKLDLPAADETANTRIGEVIGQKGDAANETAGQASAIGLLRAIITTYLNDGTIGLSKLKDLIDAIEAKVDKTLFCMDFWSDTQEEVQVDAGGGTETLPTVTVEDLPATATIVRAIAMFKFRMVENVHDGANALEGAQHIQVQAAGGTWRDAISLADNLFNFAEKAREGGDVLIGDHDIGVIEVDENEAYSFQWIANADQEFIQFNDVQCGLRIWYSV